MMESSDSSVDRRKFLQVSSAALAGAFCGKIAPAQELKNGVLYPKKLLPLTGKFSWYEIVLKKIPRLKHARGSRWPLITWENFSIEPQRPQFYRELLDRGLADHIRLDPALISTALAIQAAGSPVIVMEGNGGTYPADMAGKPEEWAHQFDAGYKPQEAVHPCPSIHVGWARFADKLRGILRQFKEKGVRVDAVWADWENDPLYGSNRYEQALHCKRCRALISRRALSSAGLFMDYTTRTFYDLFGAYYAAPILEFYPKCSVTNWLAQPSTPEQRQRDWTGDFAHIQMPPLVTAWNPSAYGAASWVWEGRSKASQRDQEHVDQVYTAVLLRQVSLTAKLGARWAPEKESIPWIARWVTEPPVLEYPLLTRERYREALRHLWLRGVAGMQIFNPRTSGFENMAVKEIEDAVAIYDEMLAYREFLQEGKILNYDVPHPGADDVLWSGLRLGNRAVVRVFKQGGGKSKQTVQPWDLTEFELEAPAQGQTYLLEKGGSPKKVP